MLRFTSIFCRVTAHNSISCNVVLYFTPHSIGATAHDLVQLHALQVHFELIGVTAQKLNSCNSLENFGFTSNSVNLCFALLRTHLHELHAVLYLEPSRSDRARPHVMQLPFWFTSNSFNSMLCFTSKLCETPHDHFQSSFHLELIWSERTTTCYSTSSCASTNSTHRTIWTHSNTEEIANDGIARTIEPQNCLLVIL